MPPLPWMYRKFHRVKCPGPNFRTFSDVHVWKQLNVHVMFLLEPAGKILVLLLLAVLIIIILLHIPPWSRSCRRFSSGWCAAGGRPLWSQGAAVPSGTETRCLRSGTGERPGAGCSPPQTHCGSHLWERRQRSSRWLLFRQNFSLFACLMIRRPMAYSPNLFIWIIW